MAKYLRRGAIGLLAGLASSITLATTLGNGGLGIVLGMFVGVGYALAFRCRLPSIGCARSQSCQG